MLAKSLQPVFFKKLHVLKLYAYNMYACNLF